MTFFGANILAWHHTGQGVWAGVEEAPPHFPDRGGAKRPNGPPLFVLQNVRSSGILKCFSYAALNRSYFTKNFACGAKSVVFYKNNFASGAKLVAFYSVLLH